MKNDFFKHILLSSGSKQNRTELETETLPYTFNSNSYKLRNYRIYGNTVNGESVGNLVTEGEHAGEYCVPVTITNGTESKTNNIYLPEQIRKVGDHAEYVDYREQKMHRVRKNLCQINKTNNAVISHAIEGQIYTFSLTADFSVGFRILKKNADSGSTETVASAFNCEGRVSATFTANENFDVYVNGFSAVDDKTFLNSVHDFMFEKGATASEYEPYIENTELDVTLPALPTLSGTNTLSVGTTVQPSKVYLQGNISVDETQSASLQSLSPQNLKTMDSNDEVSLDVMPIDSPNLQLNDISETVGGEESAE